MNLSSDLISQFVKTTKDEPVSTNSETTHYGTVVEYDGSNYVKLDGSDLLTPVSTTTDMLPGERVTVMIKNHTATVTGNITSPSARTDDLKDTKKDVDEIGNKISEFEIIIADKVSVKDFDAQTARIEELRADNVVIKDTLTAQNAVIDSLEAEDVIIKDSLTAQNASIEELKTKKLDAEVADITYATIKDLEATNLDVHNLEATYGDFVDLSTDKFTAIEADIKDLEVQKLSAAEADLKYANIDFSNIGTAAIEYFYATSGLIKDVTVGDGTVTGELVGVTIKGDLIEGGTIIADKLVIKGTDGLYYKLNTNGVTTETEQTEYNSLNGSVILAKSITATKISVEDLVAFDATIGGFNITDSAIYSGAKDSVDNTTLGVYLDKTGQIAFGDSTNFVKFYKDSEDKYRLEISASSMILSSSNKSVETMLDEMRDDIDNMDVNVDIGARNYIQKTDASKWISEWTNWMESTLTILDNRWVKVENTSGENTFGVFPPKISTIPSAGDYVLSFEAYSEDIVQLDYCYIMSDSGNTSLQTVIPITSEAARYEIPIVLNTDYTNCSVMIGARFDRGTFYVRDIQLESGTIATDWTPAPEDSGSEISNAVNDSYVKIAENTTNIIKDSESIILSAVEDTYVPISEYEEYKATSSAELSVEKDRIDMVFSETSNLGATDGEILDELAKFKKHISFTPDDGIVIGSGDAAIELKIDTDGIAFSKNGVQFGFWDGVDFLTGNIVVRVNERAQLGDFAYVPRSDRSLAFLKVN